MQLERETFNILHLHTLSLNVHSLNVHPVISEPINNLECALCRDFLRCHDVNHHQLMWTSHVAVLRPFSSLPCSQVFIYHPSHSPLPSPHSWLLLRFALMSLADWCKIILLPWCRMPLWLVRQAFSLTMWQISALIDRPDFSHSTVREGRDFLSVVSTQKRPEYPCQERERVRERVKGWMGGMGGLQKKKKQTYLPGWSSLFYLTVTCKGQQNQCKITQVHAFTFHTHV